MKSKSEKVFLWILPLFIFVQLLGTSSHALDKLQNDIKKIALVVAAPRDAIESSWGHTFLRFSNKDDFAIADQTIEFTADVSGDISYLQGLGIGSSYKINVTLGDYGATSTGYTQAMDRDLIQYELALSPQEVQHFIEMINERIEHNREDSYNFLFNNCTTGVAEIIEEVTKSKISGYSKNVPIWLPAKLKNLNLIKKEFVIPSNSTVRGKIIEKRFDNIFGKYLNNFKEYYLIFNLKDQLNSYSLNERVIAYLKMIYLVKNKKFENDVVMFAKNLINSENPTIRLQLLNLFNLLGLIPRSLLRLPLVCKIADEQIYTQISQRFSPAISLGLPS